MNLFKKHRDYIDFIYHKDEPPERQKPTTHIPVKALGIPKVVIVERR